MVQSSNATAAARAEGERKDLLAVSKARSLDTAELRKAYGRVTHLTGVANSLEMLDPATFVRYGVSLEDGARIQITGEPSPELVSQLEALPVNVTVDYGAAAGSQELADMAEALTGSVLRNPESVAAAGAAYDSATQSMTLTYWPAPRASADAVAGTLEEALQSATRDGYLPVPVTLEESSGAVPVLEATVRGGNFAGNLCTTDFTASRNGNLGVLTADHCGDTLMYNGDSTVLAPAYVLPSRTTDIQWHRVKAGHFASASFYNGFGNQTVTQVANAGVNGTYVTTGARMVVGAISSLQRIRARPSLVSKGVALT
ncbi:hypothetical protein [Nocardioides sp. B-3]|uniref:hypothetical protein n=1 Tax=Nocardioides sp. B-3 TaxID=2895565 RepID=UPI00215361F0|nr:hypothetical protein [Nocardioides sp. B-3]UUZ59901.1 hypothetical protein LP418_02315 [Nocardioides sp. B-3]